MKGLAIHESAHSVAAFALGLPVQYLSIRPHADDAGLTANILNARLRRTRTRVEDHETFTLTKPAPRPAHRRRRRLGPGLRGARAGTAAPKRELMMAWV
jgi:hypothetical protein